MVKHKEFEVDISLPSKWKGIGICYCQVKRNVIIHIPFLVSIWVKRQLPETRKIWCLIADSVVEGMDIV